jgi:hypothetical protein
MAFIVILCVGYLFNENSSLCLFGKGGLTGGTCKTKDLKDTITLTPEEQAILKSLQDKAAKVIVNDDVPVKTPHGSKAHDQYQKVMRGLWGQ